MNQPVPSAEAALDLLDVLYASVMQPHKQPAVLAQLARDLSADVAQAYQWVPTTGRVLDSCVTPAPLARANADYVAHYGAIDPRRRGSSP